MTSAKASKKSLAFIFITVLIDVMGLGIIIPILPELIETLTGKCVSESAGIGGLLLMAFAASQFLFAPLMGELSDRFGRKPVLLLALTGLGIDYLFHAFAPTIGLLFVSRVIAGIFGSSHTVAAAYIADISTPKNKAKNFGILGAAFSLGFILGPAISGICAQWGYQVPFIVAAVFSIVNVLFGLFILPESLPKEKRRPISLAKTIPFVSLAHLARYKFMFLFIIAFTMTYLAGQVLPSTWSFFTIEAYGWDEKDIAISLSVVGVLVGIAQGLLVGLAVKKFGNKKVIMGGFVLWTLGMFAFAFASSSWMLYAALVPYALGATASPVIQGIMSNSVSEKEQGNLQGALTSLISLTAVAGPVLFTSVFYLYTKSGETSCDPSGNQVTTITETADVYFPGASFFLAGLILVVSTLIALVALKQMKGHLENEDIKSSEEE